MTPGRATCIYSTATPPGSASRCGIRRCCVYNPQPPDLTPTRPSRNAQTGHTRRAATPPTAISHPHPSRTTVPARPCTRVRGLQSVPLTCTLHLGPNRPNPTPQKTDIDASGVRWVARCMVLHGLRGLHGLAMASLARMDRLFVVAHLTQTHRNANPARVCSVKRHCQWYQCIHHREPRTEHSTTDGIEHHGQNRTQRTEQNRTEQNTITRTEPFTRIEQDNTDRTQHHGQNRAAQTEQNTTDRTESDRTNTITRTEPFTRTEQVTTDIDTTESDRIRQNRTQ